MKLSQKKMKSKPQAKLPAPKQAAFPLRAGKKSLSRGRYTARAKALFLPDKPAPEQSRAALPRKKKPAVQKTRRTRAVRRRRQQVLVRGRDARRHKKHAGRRHAGQAALRVAAMAVALLFISSLAAVVVASASQAALIPAVEVLLDGIAVGVVTDEGAAQSQFDRVLDEYRRRYGMDIHCANALTYTPVHTPEEYCLTEEQLYDIISKRVQVQALAGVITVNGRQAAALKTVGDAQQVIDDILARFTTGADEGSAKIVEDISIEQCPVAYADIIDVSAAATRLLYGDNAQKRNEHLVQSDDTLESIADMNNLSVQDLYIMNPELKGRENLEGVETINAVRSTGWVNVLYTSTSTAEQVVPFETVEKQSDTMYTTQTKVEQEGQDGLSRITTQMTYKNGQPTQMQELETVVLTEKIDKVVLVGTKKVEKATGSWTLPIKYGSYVVSSRFGTRTLNGVTRQHKGVDLAAAKGTPIYASRDGTVAFSGTASGYGLVIYLNHSGNAQTRYGHCSKLLVKKGETVKKGQLIALVGNTGVSTGPHCHFEVRIAGQPVNPLTYK